MGTLDADASHLTQVVAEIAFAIVRALKPTQFQGNRMAAHGEQSDGAMMDLGEHQRTWKGFTSFIKWSLVGIGLIMALLAIFRTHG